MSKLEPSRANLSAASGNGRESAAHQPFRTIKAAAAELGIHYWLLLALVNRGAVPSYLVGNSRRRVRTAEVVAFIERSKSGGAA